MAKITIRKRDNRDLLGSVSFLLFALWLFFADFILPQNTLIEPGNSLVLGLGIIFLCIWILLLCKWYSNVKEYEVEAKEVG